MLKKNEYRECVVKFNKVYKRTTDAQIYEGMIMGKTAKISLELFILHKELSCWGH